MTPLFACFPVCLTFVALAIIALIVVALGMANRIPGDDEPKPDAPSDGTTGPPPWWVLPLMLLVIALVMLALAWYWPE
jgi:hypothetical protein